MNILLQAVNGHAELFIKPFFSLFDDEDGNIAIYIMFMLI